MPSAFVPFARLDGAIDARKVDRTATRILRVAISSPRWGDVEVRTWTTRDAMARAIRHDERHVPRSDWTPVVRLEQTEGY